MSKRLVALIGALGILVAACGGDDDAEQSAASTSSSTSSTSSSTAAPDEPDDPADDGAEDEDCGDFDCGESCETHPEKYADVCGDGFTQSGRPPVGDPSWFEDGLWGSYGESGDYVYGAIEACTDFFAGAGTHQYVLVDGDTNSTIELEVLWDTESDVATFELEPGGSSEGPYDLRTEGDDQYFAGVLDSGEEFDLKVPTEDTEDDSCVDPDHGG